MYLHKIQKTKRRVFSLWFKKKKEIYLKTYKSYQPNPTQPTLTMNL